VHHDNASKHSTPVLPVISLLITATLWGISWYPLRAAANYGLVGIWTTVSVYGCALLVGCIVFRRRLVEIKQQPGLLGLIALANGWLNVSFILAVIDGHVLRVILLFYLSPVWSTLLGWLFLKERMSSWSLATLVVAMTGAIIMLWDTSLGIPWPQQYTDWLAISSGMAFSISNVTVRKLQNSSVRIKTVSAWFGVSVIAIIWILVGGVDVPRVSVEVWLITLLIGTIMIIIMTTTVQYGVTHMPVYRSAVILLFELVAGAASAQWLSNEVIEAKEWVGGSLIVAAGYLSARAIMKQEINTNYGT
jgi:drug/metabolite transporter (DMT)-like permease